jgi:manganese transport protein
MYTLVLPVAICIGLLLIYIFLYPIFSKKVRHLSNVPHGNALEIEAVEKIVYDRIGITIDFSVNDRTTIRHALIQGGKDATYFLIHIVETAVAAYHGNSAMDHETQRDLDNVNKYRDNLEALGYHAISCVGFGAKTKSIAEITKKNKLELLVMGAHGHKGIKDIILGTTVNAVRHQVSIPVLIVK